MSGRVSTTSLAAFAGPSLPLAALGLPLVVYLPNYYSETLGLSVGAVGWAFLLVRLIDIAFDPFFGTVLDRTSWRAGRFKPWMAIGVPIVAAAVAMLFLARSGVGIAWLWAALIVIYGGYSVCVLSHSAWASTLSTDYNERSRVYAWWQTGNVVGMILVIILPVLLSLSFRDPGHLASLLAADLVGSMSVEQAAYAARVRAMGWFIIILLPLTSILAFLLVRERRITVDKTAARATPGDYLRLLKRPTVRRILIADLLMGLAPGVAGSLFFFFFERVKGFEKAEAEILLMIYFCAAVFGAPLWVWLSRRMGKHRVLIVASLAYSFVQFGVVMLPNGNFPLAIPFLIMAGLPYSAAPFLLRAMLADVGDEERLNSGVDRTGLLYAVLTGTVKIGTALAVASFIILGWLGFNAANPPASTEAGMAGLVAMYVVVPGVLGLVAAWVMMNYPLTEARHAEIRAQLDERERTILPVREDVAVMDPHVAQNPAE